MLIEDLAKAILAPPPGARHLDVVSGYLSVSAALWCLHQGRVPGSISQDSADDGSSLSVRTIVGMATAGGVSRGQHESFRQWSAQLRGRLDIRYPSRSTQRPIHSKVYVWRDASGRPISAFSGSANFTNPGLGIGATPQENVMHPVDPISAAQYADIRLGTSVDCNDPGVDAYITFPQMADSTLPSEQVSVDTDPLIQSHDFYLYSRSRMRPYADGAGVNWGRRQSRNSQDEAYIGIPAEVGRSDFFPPKNVPFTATWDDGTSMIMRGASGDARSGKDLTTLPSNSELGVYLRSRLGVSLGDRIDISSLVEYGRTYITVTKNSNGEYFFDFDPNDSAVDVAAEQLLKDWPDSRR